MKQTPEPPPFDYTILNDIKAQINTLKSDIIELRNTQIEMQESDSEDVVQYQIIPPNRIIEQQELVEQTEQSEDHDQTENQDKSEKQEQQEQQQEQQQQQPVVQEDKHDALRRLLTNAAPVYCSYKGTHFEGTFNIKPTAPHGYVIRDSQNTEYNTPTDFSFTKKRQVNPNIHSDNGWDSVYIHSGVNKKGNPKKMSLKGLVDPL